jgi:hypothetical protein
VGSAAAQIEAEKNGKQSSLRSEKRDTSVYDHRIDPHEQAAKMNPANDLKQKTISISMSSPEKDRENDKSW